MPEHSTQAEVRYFQIAIGRQQEVLWLEIPVCNAFRVQVFLGGISCFLSDGMAHYASCNLRKVKFGQIFRHTHIWRCKTSESSL